MSPDLSAMIRRTNGLIFIVIVILCSWSFKVMANQRGIKTSIKRYLIFQYDNMDIRCESYTANENDFLQNEQQGSTLKNHLKSNGNGLCIQDMSAAMKSGYCLSQDTRGFPYTPSSPDTGIDSQDLLEHFISYTPYQYESKDKTRLFWATRDLDQSEVSFLEKEGVRVVDI